MHKYFLLKIENYLTLQLHGLILEKINNRTRLTKCKVRKLNKVVNKKIKDDAVQIVIVWKGIHSRSDTNRTGAKGLSLYYPRLLYCLDQMLAVML